MMAARAWIQAGRPKEAQDELNEAVAHAPDAPATRLLLAEVALADLNPERALPHLDAAIKAEPTPDAFYLRALCRAMLGGVDGLKLDLDEMSHREPKAADADIDRRYRLAVSVFDRLNKRDGLEIRDLIQKAAIKPKDAGLHDGLTAVEQRLAARIAFMEMMATPATLQKTHDRWLLADKLLAESLVNVRSFIGGADDALTDARMNLGEGIKQADLARSAG